MAKDEHWPLNTEWCLCGHRFVDRNEALSHIRAYFPRWYRARIPRRWSRKRITYFLGYGHVVTLRKHPLFERVRVKCSCGWMPSGRRTDDDLRKQLIDHVRGAITDIIDGLTTCRLSFTNLSGGARD
jgi:hypothetical protein